MHSHFSIAWQAYSPCLRDYSNIIQSFQPAVVKNSCTFPVNPWTSSPVFHLFQFFQVGEALNGREPEVLRFTDTSQIVEILFVWSLRIHWILIAQYTSINSRALGIRTWFQWKNCVFRIKLMLINDNPVRTVRSFDVSWCDFSSFRFSPHVWLPQHRNGSPSNYCFLFCH